MQLQTLKKDLKLAKTILTNKAYKCIIQVTNRCNMTCSFCDFWPNGVPPNLEMQISDYEKLADELNEIGCFIISIEGGEPLVRSDIVDIVRVFSQKHIPILFTNGWYVDEEKAKKLFEAGLAQIGVSIDFPDADRHDKKRGLKGAFERGLKAIQFLRDAAPNGGKQVYMMSVLMKENQHDIEQLLKLSQPYEIGHTFNLISTNGFRRKANDALPDIPLSETLLQYYKKYEHLKVFRQYLELVDVYTEGGKMPTCRAGLQSFNVDHIGNIAPCIEKTNEVYGNIRKDTLKEVMNKLSKNSEIAHCQDCFTLCRGFSQCMDQRGSLKSWQDLGTRMKTS